MSISAIRITKFEVPEEAQEGDDVLLRCEYDLEGGPLNYVKLFHNNLQFYLYIPGSGGWAFPEKGMTVDLEKSDDKQVSLKNVSKKLSGEYKCEVSLDKPLSTKNECKKGGSDCVINVKIEEYYVNISLLTYTEGGKLRDVKIQLPENISEGTKSTVLECKYNLDGLPLKEIKWYKDATEFYSYKPGNPPNITFTPQLGVDVLVSASNDKEVILRNIKLDTEGDYRCQVTAGNKSLQSLNSADHLTITRVGRLNVGIALPQNVQNGDRSALLQCNYDLDGTRLYSVKWYKDGNEFYRFMPDEIPTKQYFAVPGVTVVVNVSDDKNVIITDITQQTSGTYSCQVTSVDPIDQSSTAEANLIVLNSKPPGSGNFFDKAVGWFRNRWNDIRHRN
ncbi:hypothetical protein C0J52_00242 [Blattella germanica]|nr:hypothetical protein C0J52_00242 [Blattella germanica]